MKIAYLAPETLAVSPELARSGTSKVFEEHLLASIEEMGLAEPLKVAPLPSGDFLVVDGVMRLKAINAIRAKDGSRFTSIPAYIVDYKRRFELRYQTDIYQDLLPSQLATLVEHLHEAEAVRKNDIARYIGVSPATLRNYTGLWRLLQRGGLFAKIVELMDVGVLPASNPYAWLRLTHVGLRKALLTAFTDGRDVDAWMEQRIAGARRGDAALYPLKFVEAATGDLPADCYQQPEEVRNLKRELGLRRAAAASRSGALRGDPRPALARLAHVSEHSRDRLLQIAARSLTDYLQ